MDFNDVLPHLVTAAVTLGSAVTAMHRSLKQRAVTPQELAEAKKQIEQQQVTIVQLLEFRNNQEQIRREDHARVLRHDELLRSMVTTEEFKAYTHQTTTSVHGLTERVGRLIGYVDANR